MGDYTNCSNDELRERAELLRELHELEQAGDCANCSNEELTERIDLLRELAEIESE